MDLEVLDHAENKRHFEVMKHPHRGDGFEEIRKLVQYWKSRSRITCINMDLKSELIPRIMLALNLGL